MMTMWEIERTKVVTILRDNAANVISGLGMTGIEHESCFIHSLQLVINDGLQTQRTVGDMLANCSKDRWALYTLPSGLPSPERTTNEVRTS